MPHLSYFLVVFALSVSSFVSQAAVEIRITGDSVNLRAAPTNTAEVVDQVSTGDVLQSIGSAGNWIQVIPPPKVDLWVFDEFITDNRVAVSKLHVRGGPGINYKTVGMLDKGDEVISRGVKGEWRKIAPLPSCALWISSDYAEVVEVVVLPDSDSLPVDKKPLEETPLVDRTPPMPADGKLSALSAPSVVNVKPVPPTASLSSSHVRNVSGLIDMSKLQKDVVQGALVKRAGVLKPSGFVWRNPGKYRLVVYDKWDRAVTICYIIGEQRRLESMEDEDVYVVGHEYWIYGLKNPVVVIDRIILNN